MKRIILASILLIVVLAIFASPAADLPKSALRAQQLAMLAILGLAVVARQLLGYSLCPSRLSRPLRYCTFVPLAVYEVTDLTCVRLC